MHADQSRVLAALAGGVVILGLADPQRSALAFDVFKVGGAANCPYHTIQAAVDAAAALAGEDYVWIARDQAYPGQAIHVSDADGVDIEGGFDDCDDFDPENQQTTISGAGNGGQAVFTFTGANRVYLANVSVTGAARDGDASGGGISFDGSGVLTVATSYVIGNSAGYGGGINMKAADGQFAALIVSHDTVIFGNTAQTSGGGIRVEGQARLDVLSPTTWIASNHAPNGFGGGIEMLGPSIAEIGSSGFINGPVIENNDAQYGGGIAAISQSGQQPTTLHVYSTDASHPVQISNNIASAAGGGIYLKPFSGQGGSTSPLLCARDFVFDDNIAQEGSAIYADEDHDVIDIYEGSRVYLNAFEGNGCPGASVGVRCAAGVACNEINRNIAEDSAGQVTAGSAVLLQSAGTLVASRFSMRGNQGAHALRFVSDEGGYFELFTCLVAENQASDRLILATPYSDQSHFTVSGCTIANNAIANDPVLFATTNFVELNHAVIDQPGRQALGFTTAPGDVTVHYVLANDISTLPSAADVVQGSPMFEDATAHDYRLTRCSRGVDAAPADAGTAPDLSGRARSVDLVSVPNGFGAQDLGAYEIQTGDTGEAIFCASFDSP